MTTSRRAFLAGLAASAAATGACATPDRSTAPATPGAPGTGPATTAPRPTTATPSPAPSTTSTASVTGSGQDLLHGPRGRPAVALTFHGAGDPTLARRVLHEAAAAQAHLTVLAVGTWLERNPGLAGSILDAGHDLGNHTWSHQPMRRLDAAGARREVARAAALLTRLTGSHGTWFRPSGTPRSTARIRAAALASGYPRCLAYDLDPLDYTDPGAASVTRRVLAGVRSGSIVSLHLGHAGTVEALPHILTGLGDKGLAAVSMTTLTKGVA